VHRHVLAGDHGTRVLPERNGPVATSAIAIPRSSKHVDELIETHLDVARSIARSYRNRGVDLEDLEQVALLGLTKAAKRFEVDAGHHFLSYAVPTIRGEIRRYFRDAAWMVRPPRRVQDIQGRVRRSQSELEVQLGRSPRPSELAAHLGEDLDDVVEALTANGCFTPTSLDKPPREGELSIGELISEVDEAMESAEARVVLRPVLTALTERDRRVLHMRFYEGRTQQEIADDLGLTQAQVSRVLSRILANLRIRLDEPSSAA